MKPKHATSYSLTAEAASLLQAIGAHLGLSNTATLEVIIREAAEKRGLREIAGRQQG